MLVAALLGGLFAAMKTGFNEVTKGLEAFNGGVLGGDGGRSAKSRVPKGDRVLLVSGVVQLLCNSTMPDLFPVNRIGYWQALRLFLLALLLFGGPITG